MSEMEGSCVEHKGTLQDQFTPKNPKVTIFFSITI